MGYVKRDWYAGLRGELETEIRLCVNRKRTQGKEGWGDARKSAKRYVPKSTVQPLFPMFAKDDEKDGRSLAYHAEVVEEMIVRHELGMSLWSDEVADTDDDCVGVELNRSERTMMEHVLNQRDAHLERGKLRIEAQAQAQETYAIPSFHRPQQTDIRQILKRPV